MGIRNKRSGYFSFLISRIPVLGQINTRGAPIHIYGIWKDSTI